MRAIFVRTEPYTYTRATKWKGAVHGTQHNRQRHVSSFIRSCRASILITSLVLSVFLAGSIALISGVFASRQAAELRAIEAIEWQTVSVAQGDSLWKIAEARPVDGLGTDALVDAIMQRNGMTKGALMAGDDLQVPVSQS